MSNPSCFLHSFASASSCALLPNFKRRSTPAVTPVSTSPFNVPMSPSFANHSSHFWCGQTSERVDEAKRSWNHPL